MPLVLGLGLVAVAFLVILFAHGARIVSQVIANMLSQLPLGIGSFIVRNLPSLEIRLLTFFIGWAAQAVAPAVDLVRRVTYLQWRLWDQSGTVAQATAVALRTITQVTIPRFF